MVVRSGLASRLRGYWAADEYPGECVLYACDATRVPGSSWLCCCRHELQCIADTGSPSSDIPEFWEWAEKQ